MISKVKSIVLFILFLSCSSSKKGSDVNYLCNENLKFKKEFFKHLKIINDFMSIETKTKFVDFDEYERAISVDKVQGFNYSLLFISRYVHVSYDSMLNYARTYPIAAYKKDKDGWLHWYEENKCNDLQFKQ
jgi:hypothetical protein